MNQRVVQAQEPEAAAFLEVQPLFIISHPPSSTLPSSFWGFQSFLGPCLLCGPDFIALRFLELPLHELACWFLATGSLRLALS